MSGDAQCVMLAQTWDESVDPTGWWMSEKLDGVRAYWSGSRFYSRQGNEFLAPPWFTRDLPKEPLDGELWCGRGLFSKTLSIIKKQKDAEKFYDNWKYVTYLVFDAPKLDKPYEGRVAWLNKNINVKKETTYAAVVGVAKCTGMTHLNSVLKQILLKRGEGIMLRKPGSAYEHKRSHNLLKVKYFHDEECQVLGKSNGTGRCLNMMGKLHCQLPNGVKFDVGTGFSDAQRRSPPKIGSVITFKFQELSDHGHPRFPVFVRERSDLTWSDVLATAKTKPPFSCVKLKKKEVTKPTLAKQHSIMFCTVPSRSADGKKIVTTDDVDEDLGEESELKGDDEKDKGEDEDEDGDDKRKVCKYGTACYRTNKAHTDHFRHPDREKKGNKSPTISKSPKPSSPSLSSSSSSPSSSSSSSSSSKSPKTSSKLTVDGKKPCIFGKDCFRTNKEHFDMYTHDLPVADVDEEDVDLEQYYLLKGDEDEEVIKNELSQEREEEENGEEKAKKTDGDEEKGSLSAVAPAPKSKQFKSGGGGTKSPTVSSSSASSSSSSSSTTSRERSGWFVGCASDDDGESGSGADAGAGGDRSPSKSVSIPKTEYEALKRIAKEVENEKVTISKAEYEELKRIAAKRKRETEGEKENGKKHAPERDH